MHFLKYNYETCKYFKNEYRDEKKSCRLSLLWSEYNCKLLEAFILMCYFEKEFGNLFI